MSRKILLTLAAVVMMTGAVSADVIPIANFSFETPPAGDNGFYGSPATGWTTVQGVFGRFDPQDGAFPGTTGNPGATSLPGTGDGHQAAVLTGNHTAAGIGRLADPVAHTFLPTNTYTLTVAAGRRADTWTTSNFDFTIQLATADGSTVYASTDVSTADVPLGSFADFQVDWTPTSNTSGVYVRFVGTNASTQGIYLDNVRLESNPVPEPATLGFLALGGVMGLTQLIRRRRGA
jgi:hypothetical protein